MNAPTKPGTIDHHPHHHDDHQDHHCPDHYDRCYINLSGYMDCPHTHPHAMKTEMLTVSCGADDPKPQVAAFLNAPGHEHVTVAQVLDLGHNGWLVIFNVPE